ncbi:MAG: tyrosine-type recombinase/integrase [Blautia sp.]|nr:tyrosine-type recombinase/integrase [Blautia sp.]
MAKPISYREQEKIENTVKLREFLKELPPYVKDYFRAKEPTTSDKTRLSYAYDLRVFFRFLKESNPALKEKSICDISLADLSSLKPVDFEEFEEFLKAYQTADGRLETNSRVGIARKMSCLRSFYEYLCKRQLVPYNPVRMVDMPRVKEKAIIQLDPDEVVTLLDHIENYGNQLSGVQLYHYNKQKYRDLAIVTLLLGTGVRVSECVGLNISDIDFKNNGIRILRKGGNEMVVYFGEEVEKALKDYLDLSRNGITPLAGHEDALFLSGQRKRISVDAVEKMVKKYCSAVSVKTITPHKLRSTYGTALYRETGDIYLVADVLGHADVNTTKKHYARLTDDRRRAASKAVILRENTDPFN